MGRREARLGGVFEDVCRRQHGVLTRRQAFECGMTRAQISAHLRGRRWQRLLPRVYATFTGPPQRSAYLWAVVLWAGRGAVLSHETAAELAGLCDEPTEPVHVTIPEDRRVRAVPGVVVHHSSCPRAHPTHLPPRTRTEDTVIDLVRRSRSLEQAVAWIARACGRRLTTAQRLRAALLARRKMPWRAEIAAVLGDIAEGCQSPLELRYLREVERRHRLPRAERQAVRLRRGGRWYDDVAYRPFQVRVELDGRAAHPAEARQRDARRDNAAVESGDVVLRYGWGDVVDRPCAVAAQVAAVLARRGWTRRPVPCSRAHCEIR